MSGIPPGNNLRSRLPGMLVKNVCILCWGMSGSAGDELPESTRDKLPAGEMDSTFLGKLLDWTFPGKFLICTGEVAPLNALYTAGEQS